MEWSEILRDQVLHLNKKFLKRKIWTGHSHLCSDYYCKFPILWGALYTEHWNAEPSRIIFSWHFDEKWVVPASVNRNTDPQSNWVELKGVHKKNFSLPPTSQSLSSRNGVPKKIFQKLKKKGVKGLLVAPAFSGGLQLLTVKVRWQVFFFCTHHLGPFLSKNNMTVGYI